MHLSKKKKKVENSSRWSLVTLFRLPHWD